MSRQDKRNSMKKYATAKTPVADFPKKQRNWRIPVIPVFFVVVWMWAWLYYGCVLEAARDNSFWVLDSRQMQFMLSCSFPNLRWVGRALLQLYKYPWLGGLLLSLMLTFGSWLTGYCLKLEGKWRFLRFLPAFVYIGLLTYQGINAFFEEEAGFILAGPLVYLAAMAIAAVLVKITTHREFLSTIMLAKDEKASVSVRELAFCLVMFAAIVGFNESQRPYSRTITRLALLHDRQDWRGIQEVARANATQSNRPMACMYAISLVHTGEITQRMYDIRLDYDSLYLKGMDGYHNNATALYVPEGSYHAGLIETCMHQCMEIMVMTGPTVRLLKLLVKCAIMRNETELADKYLRILEDVPFEKDFCVKYRAMNDNIALVDKDPEMARIRMTEPIHDSFENYYQQPAFMGYNLALVEGRSMEALQNSLCVCLYTKLMPQFVERLQPLAGTTPPDIIADGILLASAKRPGLDSSFPGLQYRSSKLQGFMESIQPFMKDRAGHAYELFSKYKGYYPYYYFFGNLKATKKGYTNANTSSSGVN